MGDENPILGVSFGGLKAKGCRELSGTPCEIKHMRFDKLPRLTQIFGHVKLLENLARLSVVKVGAGGPAGSQGPSPLLGMIGELMDLLTRVEGTKIATTIFGNPVDAVSA